MWGVGMPCELFVRMRLDVGVIASILLSSVILVYCVRRKKSKTFPTPQCITNSLKYQTTRSVSDGSNHKSSPEVLNEQRTQTGTAGEASNNERMRGLGKDNGESGTQRGSKRDMYTNENRRYCSSATNSKRSRESRESERKRSSSDRETAREKDGKGTTREKDSTKRDMKQNEKPSKKEEESDEGKLKERREAEERREKDLKERNDREKDKETRPSTVKTAVETEDEVIKRSSLKQKVTKEVRKDKDHDHRDATKDDKVTNDRRREEALRKKNEHEKIDAKTAKQTTKSSLRRMIRDEANSLDGSRIFFKAEDEPEDDDFKAGFVNRKEPSSGDLRISTVDQAIGISESSIRSNASAMLMPTNIECHPETRPLCNKKVAGEERTEEGTEYRSVAVDPEPAPPYDERTQNSETTVVKADDDTMAHVQSIRESEDTDTE